MDSAQKDQEMVAAITSLASRVEAIGRKPKPPAIERRLGETFEGKTAKWAIMGLSGTAMALVAASMTGAPISASLIETIVAAIAGIVGVQGFSRQLAKGLAKREAPTEGGRL